ncbi:N-formylglutamate amidohydrolase [Sinimarinibacterium sp. CAU 1509]|uniref:N-formylglutamate amidohydrolase n=1 Tax=Sinimarinibacterium sp. CAU 1509 TaxID=2562283 RepID=UPI001469E497|nr:N-formylglutamate amidohydrolase [Sinimarinibacterium sp. CAU 1509]
MNAILKPLFESDETEASTLYNANGGSEFLLVCEYASPRLPASLGTLGLKDTQLDGPLAWDIGAVSVARLLSDRLEAPLIEANYSRLVIDCNRPLDAADSINCRTEWGEIDGNLELDPEAVAERIAGVFTPFHDTLRKLIDQRLRARRPTRLIALRSFAPSFRGDERPWDISLMFDRDARLGHALQQLLKRDERLQVGINEPQSMDDTNDYTLSQHAESRGLPHVGLSIRQDLITDVAGQKNWAGRLASLLKQAGAGLKDV